MSLAARAGRLLPLPRRIAFLLISVACLAALSPGVAGPGAAVAAEPAPVPKTSLPEIEDEVMCPVCKTLLSLSASPAAQRERVFIRRLIARGKTKDEIKDALVAEYGGQVLAEPDQGGIGFWAYALPTALILLAALAVAASILRLRRRGDSRPPPEDGSDGEAGSGDPDSVDRDDDERLERDMARFDL